MTAIMPASGGLRPRASVCALAADLQLALSSHMKLGCRTRKGITMNDDAWDDLTDAHGCFYHRACCISRDPGNDWMRIDVCVRAQVWPQPHIDVIVSGKSGEMRTFEPSHPGDMSLPVRLRKVFADLHYPSVDELVASVRSLLAKDEALINNVLKGRGHPRQFVDKPSGNRLQPLDYEYHDRSRPSEDFGKPDVITRSGAFGAKTAHVAKWPRNHEDE